MGEPGTPTAALRQGEARREAHAKNKEGRREGKEGGQNPYIAGTLSKKCSTAPYNVRTNKTRGMDGRTEGGGEEGLQVAYLELQASLAQQGQLQEVRVIQHNMQHGTI
jgi:hypothetical protein